MIKRVRERAFVLYFGLFLIATYLGLSQYFLVIFFILCFFFAILFNRKILGIFKKVNFSFPILFIFYYLVISLLNYFLGNIELKDFLNAIIKYALMPLSIIFLIPTNSKGRENLFKALKTFLVISLFFGSIETILKSNFIDSILKIGDDGWQSSHYINGDQYQPSSLFLHYSYYAFVLIFLWILNWISPYKNFIFNWTINLLIIFQILICQSRINWICFAVILLFQYFLIIKNKEHKKARTIALFAVIIAIFCLIFFSQQITDFILARFGNLFSYGMKDGSLGQRVGTFLNFGKYLSLNSGYGLFGLGFNGIEKYLLDYSYFSGFSTADSEFTVFLVDIGILGTIIAVFAFIQLFLRKGAKYSTFTKAILICVLVNCVTLDFFSNGILDMLFYFACFISYIEKKRVFLLRRGYIRENLTYKICN